MAWEWSHTDEGETAAHENLHELDRETLIIIMAEWNTEICNAGEFLDGYYDKAVELLTLDHQETCEILADRIWTLCSDSQEINGQWFGRTCDNGGHNAWVCPYGCHTVPFDREGSDND